MDRVTIICRAVAHEHKLTVEDLMRPTHERRISRPRQIAMGIAREMTDRSLPDLASRFVGERGNAVKHHTTVLWAVRRCAELRQHDPEFRALFDKCKARAERYMDAGPETPEIEPVKGKSSYADMRNEVAFLRKRVADLELEVAIYAEKERRQIALESVYERARSPKATVSGRSAA